MASRPLEKVKVLEYASLVAGPYCTKLLAALGADVIKIERPGEGDPARQRGPYLGDIPDPERSGLFLWLNTDKRSMSLDVSLSTGKEVFHKLLKWADILVQDLPPKEAVALGIDYATVKGVNPRIIQVSITSFGQTGPYRDMKAYPFNAWHAGGAGYLCPAGLVPALFPDRPPLKGGNYVGEYDIGVEAAAGTLIALYWKLRSGQGQHVDVSKQEVFMKIYELDLQAFPNEGIAMTKGTSWPHPRPSLEHMNPLASMSPLKCKDGYIIVIAPIQYQWEYLVKGLGNPLWAREFNTGEERNSKGGELRRRLEAWTSQRTRDEAVAILQKAGCPAGPYYSPAEVMDSEHLTARDFWVELDHPRAGRLRYAGVPCKFKVHSWRPQRAAPLLGEHNKEILCDLLKYPCEEVVKLRETGVV